LKRVDQGSKDFEEGLDLWEKRRKRLGARNRGKAIVRATPL